MIGVAEWNDLEAGQDVRFLRGYGAARLLVSVRNAGELQAARAGGAEILDLKDPSAGPLGCVSQAVFDAIGLQTSLPLMSAALGEVADWTISASSTSERHSMNSLPVPRLPTQIRLCKLGLSGLASQNDRANWIEPWLAVRRRFEAANKRPLNWVAVAYADWQAAKSPPPMDVVAAAISTNCVGVLVDTFQKSNGRLWNWLSVAELNDLAATAHAANRFFAVAGRLSSEDFEKLAGLHADIVAIRSAACADGDRGKVVETAAVARFRQGLRES